MVFQIIAHVNRTKDLDWKIKYSSQWIGITDNLDNVIEKEKITQVFSCTNSEDELFIQTVAYDCGFKEGIYQPELNQTTNMRFIDWNREEW